MLGGTAQRSRQEGTLTLQETPGAHSLADGAWVGVERVGVRIQHLVRVGAPPAPAPRLAGAAGPGAVLAARLLLHHPLGDPAGQQGWGYISQAHHWQPEVPLLRGGGCSPSRGAGWPCGAARMTLGSERLPPAATRLPPPNAPADVAWVRVHGVCIHVQHRVHVMLLLGMMGATGMT